ncbi:MAG TPA: diiron oxygenase [Streptosporangiaceae bacterium]|jgi:hypothetical protein
MTAASAEAAAGWTRLADVAGRLSRVSREHRYDVHEIFDWPSSLPSGDYWMSPELTTTYGTSIWDDLAQDARIRLSQCEAVNFFSVNVHLIRDLIGEVADRIYVTRHPGLSEFFHDFIHEENSHMWFFARFCQLYGGKVYPVKKLAGGPADGPEVIRDVVVFGRILIAEELCDVYNARMAGDTRLPPIARQINAVHHDDESRHIAFGRQMMRALHAEAVARATPDELKAAAQYLGRYVSVCLRSLYNPAMYADAGLADGHDIRRRLLADPARQAAHRDVMGRSVIFLSRLGLLDPDLVAW